MTRDEARRALIDWRLQRLKRDRLVRDAIAAGVSKRTVHELSGIARTTIDRIIKEQS